MKNIENSHEILSLMSCKMLLNCTEMAYINTIHDRISFLAISIT